MSSLNSIPKFKSDNSENSNKLIKKEIIQNFTSNYPIKLRIKINKNLQIIFFESGKILIIDEKEILDLLSLQLDCYVYSFIFNKPIIEMFHRIYPSEFLNIMFLDGSRFDINLCEFKNFPFYNNMEQCYKYSTFSYLNNQNIPYLFGMRCAFVKEINLI